MKPRNPVIALLLSLLFPGLGHLYAGHQSAAVLIFASWFAVTYCLELVVGIVPTNTFLIGIGLSRFVQLAFYFCSAYSAYRFTKKFGPHGSVTRWTRWYACLGVYIVLCTASTQLDLLRREHLYEPYHIPTITMSPTLLLGDRVYFDKSLVCPLCWNQLQRGDILIFHPPIDPKQIYTKRLIGLPGDKISVEDGRLKINDKELSRTELNKAGEFVIYQEQLEDKTYLIQLSQQPTPDARKARHYPQTTVPANSLFVLGDNRDNSFDSRYWGFVSADDVLGKAKVIWFSREPGVRTRWERIGITF